MSKFTTAAQSILSEAQQQRFIIEDFRPLADSLEWELGQRYLRERGSKAFLSDSSPVPFVINNDGMLSRQAAETFFSSLVQAEKAGPLEEKIVVLELGIGIGLFARFFLDAFKELRARENKDYYRRLTYVAGDRSERMLADACRHGVFVNHAGHYLIRVVDAMDPRPFLIGDPVIPGQQPFRAVFLNYLLDCLPAADLKIKADEVSQLYVRTCLARNLHLGEYTNLSPQEIARKARSGSPTDHRALLELYGLFASEYDYRPVAGTWAAPAIELLPEGAIADEVLRTLPAREAQRQSIELTAIGARSLKPVAEIRVVSDPLIQAGTHTDSEEIL